eukprot:gnl/TRDRNA2_/TRDRNA2_160276_c0_seq3.p1 gnl/TRDRNA2_/TRDRNA2_160276_c0~~gnl/TRDRNA2_/TRDRNA2_160276_c0_seq3.p1  ORF type:complete len:245 (+),score=31.82 gnl/TRDRNA2_/TRDRNA2_160276_c0_seq3:71-805(+)
MSQDLLLLLSPCNVQVPRLSDKCVMKREALIDSSQEHLGSLGEHLRRGKSVLRRQSSWRKYNKMQCWATQSWNTSSLLEAFSVEELGSQLVSRVSASGEHLKSMVSASSSERVTQPASSGALTPLDRQVPQQRPLQCVAGSDEVGLGTRCQNAFTEAVEPAKLGSETATQAPMLRENTVEGDLAGNLRKYVEYPLRDISRQLQFMHESHRRWHFAKTASDEHEDEISAERSFLGTSQELIAQNY